MTDVWGPHPAAPPVGYPPAPPAAPPPAGTDAAPPLPAGDEPPAPVRRIPFGVPTSAAGAPPVEVLEPKAAMGHEDIARAWVNHLRLVSQDFAAVLAVLPHGAVRKVLAEAGPVDEQLAAGVL